MRRYYLYFVAFALFLCVPAAADQASANNAVTVTPPGSLYVYLGAVKIGSTETPCSKELIGTLRSQNSRLQFCDGASWRNVSLDKGQ